MLNLGQQHRAIAAVGLCALLANGLYAAAAAGGSGNVAAACNPKAANHYESKGTTLEKSGSYVDAAFAYGAAIANIAACRPLTPALAAGFYILLGQAANADLLAATTANNLDVSERWLHNAREALNYGAQVRSVLNVAPLRTEVKSGVVGTDRVMARVRSTAQIAQQIVDRGRAPVSPAPFVPPPLSSARTAVGSGSCDNDTITTVSSDGAFVATLSGGRYIIDAVDRVDSMLWLETDDVTICDDGYSAKLIHEGDVVHGHIAR